MTHTGDLHLTKECSSYTGQAGDFCTISSSNLAEVEVGTKVVYAEAAGSGTLDTDIVLDGGPDNKATGHVVLDLAAGTGVVTISGGTGRFAALAARADVSADAAGLWHWDGTYAFSDIRSSEPTPA